MPHLAGPKLSIIAVAAGLLVSSLALSPSAKASESEASAIGASMYAVYTMGYCRPGGVWFYPPFFGIEDAFDPAEQSRVHSRMCSIELRWEVLRVEGDTAVISISMHGWPLTPEATWNVISVGNQTWDPPHSDAIYGEILSVLVAEHTLTLNLQTMDVYEAGDYVGRWGFQVTTAEVATGSVDIIRNWYGGTEVTLPARVTKSLEPYDAQNLEATYGVDTFVSIFGGGGTAPDGVRKYLSKGWGARQETMPVAGRYHDPTTGLLLVSYSWHYDDLLYGLYGMLMLTDWGSIPGGLPGSASFMHLVDTNVIDMPEPVDQGETGGDGSGDEEGTGGNAEDPGPGADPGGSDDTTPPPSEFPWTTVGLLGAVAVATVILAYLRMRPPSRRGRP